MAGNLDDTFVYPPGEGPFDTGDISPVHANVTERKSLKNGAISGLGEGASVGANTSVMDMRNREIVEGPASAAYLFPTRRPPQGISNGCSVGATVFMRNAELEDFHLNRRAVA
jgi:hypothetical protein